MATGRTRVTTRLANGTAQASSRGPTVTCTEDVSASSRPQRATAPDGCDVASCRASILSAVAGLAAPTAFVDNVISGVGVKTHADSGIPVRGAITG